MGYNSHEPYGSYVKNRHFYHSSSAVNKHVCSREKRIGENTDNKVIVFTPLFLRNNLTAKGVFPWKKPLGCGLIEATYVTAYVTAKKAFKNQGNLGTWKELGW